MKPSVLVLDCGATNVRACLVDNTGKVIASQSLPNGTLPDPFYRGGLIWDIPSIWNKLCACTRKICSGSGNTGITAVTVTTFGVDGTAVKKSGELCYPVISWQCSRTEHTERNISKYFDPEWLYRTTGLQSYHFNTIYKLIWLHENRPEVLRDMDHYVLMPSLILHRLTGEFVTDTTMAGTTMLTSLKERRFSKEILSALDLQPDLFPSITEPGRVMGRVSAHAAEELGISEGISVVAGGHDTQFAILASGASVNQPVLSSGTWEILMVRSTIDTLKIPDRNSGVTIEWDALPGLVNPGVQWVASGVMEWITRLFFSDLSANSDRYSIMIREAASVPPGCHGTAMIPELFPGGFTGRQGALKGLSHETTRAHIYRAGLEALSFYLAYGLEKLQRVGNFTAHDIICVGGGSKNVLWNQIRADILGRSLKIPDVKEATALGAALLAFTGIGMYRDLEEALFTVKNTYEIIEPSENREVYMKLYEAFINEAFPNKTAP